MTEFGRWLRGSRFVRPSTDPSWCSFAPTSLCRRRGDGRDDGVRPHPGGSHDRPPRARTHHLVQHVIPERAHLNVDGWPIVVSVAPPHEQSVRSVVLREGGITRAMQRTRLIRDAPIATSISNGAPSTCWAIAADWSARWPGAVSSDGVADPAALGDRRRHERPPLRERDDALGRRRNSCFTLGSGASSTFYESDRHASVRTGVWRSRGAADVEVVDPRSCGQAEGRRRRGRVRTAAGGAALGVVGV